MLSTKCGVLIILLSVYIQKASLQIQFSETTVIPYQIAGIFEPNAVTQQYAFNESMRNIHYDEFKVQPVIIQPTRTDSYSVWRELCKMKKMRPIAVFGPQNPLSDRPIRDQCAIANIPHIQATWQPLDLDAEELYAAEGQNKQDDENAEENEEELTSEPTFKKISINFFPDSAELSVALAKLIKFYSWESFSILYEDNFGLMRVQKVMAEISDKHQIIVRRLDPDASNHKIFKQLSAYQESRIVIDCHVDRIQKYIAEADQQNMVNHYQHYIFVSMDTSTIANKLVSLPCNTTWLSLTEYDKLADSQHFLAPRVGKWNGPKPNYSTTVPQFEIESLLMDDIANHLVRSLTKIRKPVSYICEQEGIPWQYGATFQQRILQEQTTGVTGNIQFDDRGRRINYVLYVNEINNNKIGTTGTWESANGTTIITNDKHTLQVHQPSSKKFRIISRRNKPFFDYKPKCEGDNCEEDDDDDIKFEGFAVDLVKEIFKFLQGEGYNYTYEFIHEEDKNYGKYDEKEKKWNGLIGDLLDKKADLAVCDFTITEERKKVIDFSVPFMSLGISILYKEEHPAKPAMFSFLNPYTFDVWLYTATAYCVVSIVLFLCARISPADWENPEPCDKDPEVLENIWFFKNCMWLTLGSIMTQGCDILPKAIGTRWVCGMWWFFAVIVCQTYIAQLSASMTSALEEEPINSVEDLAQQTKILYGAFDGGSTLEFFKTSKDKMYQQIYQVMMANPALLVDDSDEGERRVLKGKTKYAFFMESATIEYRLQRNCDLKKVGTELDSKDYGIAMPANSPFRTNINRAILKLKELTILDVIKKKWWTEKYGAVECPPKKNENDVEGDLEMENLIGAFIVLVVGLVFSVFITAAEFTNEVRNIVIREQLSHKEAFVQELRASLNFFQMQKPVLRNPSRAPSVAPSLKSESIKQEKKAELIQNFLEFEKEDALKKGDTLSQN